MSFQFITSPRTQDLAFELENGVKSDHLILVGSQLMERMLRRRLQQVLKGPAPAIRVLENWLEEQAMIWDEGEQRIVVSPKEVELLFDYWLEHHDTSGLSLRFPDMVAALALWLVQMARGGLDPREIGISGSPILKVMADFSGWMSSKSYRIRESLPGAADTSRYKRVWLYQVDHLFPVQFQALSRFQEKLTVLLCTPETASPNYVSSHLRHWNQSQATPTPAAPPRVRMQSFPTPHDEVSAVIERLFDALAADPSFSLSDVVVLVSDLALYRPHIETLGRLYSMPVQCSQGDTLRSNPILNRFAKLLRLRLNGFHMTDIMEVFGDKLILFPGATSRDVRHVYQNCVKRNKQTLRDAGPDVLPGLTVLFGNDKPRPLSKWCVAQIDLLGRFKTEADKETRTRKEQFVELVKEFGATYEKLGLDPMLSESAFFHAFDAFLSGKPERTEDKPGALLFTEIHHFPDVHGKLAIVIGLTDKLHPGRAEHPILMRLGAELGKLVEDHTPDPFLEARHHLERIFQSAKDIWMSYPESINDAKTTPGMLWTDAASRFPSSIPWPAASGKVWDLTSARVLSGDPLAQLLAIIGAERRMAEPLGVYDGILSTPYVKALAWNRITVDGVLPLSNSRLDTYSSSPFDFLFHYVLRIGEDERFRDDADVRVKGTVLHQILQEFHSLGIWPDESRFDEALRAIRTIADRVMDQHADDLGSPDSPFPSMFCRQVMALLPWILKGETERMPVIALDGFRPKHLEMKWEEDCEIAGTPVRFNGIIDRVDVAENSEEALIIDYKTGSSKQPDSKDIEAGQAFQMALYWWILRERGLRPIASAYWKLPIHKGRAGMEWQEVLLAEEKCSNTRRRKSIRPLDENDEIVDRVIDEHIPQIILGIRNGHFPLPIQRETYPSPYVIARRWNEAVQVARGAESTDEEDSDDE